MEDNSSFFLEEFDFEKNFDERKALEWMKENWSKSFFFCGLYVVLVFVGRHLMRDRQQLNLRRPLVVWSLSLAAFSIMGTLRTGRYMLAVLAHGGVRRSVCNSGVYSAPVAKFWAFAFVLSKAPELGDTVFIVLRKKPLLFLHWYHHVTVLLYSCVCYVDRAAGGGWFASVNFLVHSFMYSYYAARAAGLPVPRRCAMLITVAQTLQMGVGLAVLTLAYHWGDAAGCPALNANILWGAAMYLSYLLLFASFFYNTYIRGPAPSSSSGVKESKVE